MSVESLVWAIASGFIPAFIWLLFWLKEDESPEPNHLIILAFWGGMLAIPVALILSKLWQAIICPGCGAAAENPPSFAAGIILLVGFAFVEEFAKYLMTKSLIFWRKEYDEPADAMIYLITGALGFAAIENILYLVEPFGLGFRSGLEITNLRFIGATPLHALSAGILGYFIAGSFFKTVFRKEIALALGLVCATSLHALFNILILVSGLSGGYRIEPALALIATSGIVILFAFERIKHKIKRYYA